VTGELLSAAPVDVSTPVLVLRRRLGEFQHGVLAVARSAGRLGIPVHCVRLDRREPATRSRYVSGELELPPDGSDEDWIEALLAIGHRLQGGILLPIDDLAAVAVGDHQERLSERFTIPLQPDGLQRRLASKLELWRLCQRLDLPTAASAFPRSAQEAAEHAEAFGYPVVLKCAEPWLPQRDPTAPSVAIVTTAAELRDAYNRMESEVEPQVMVQDYIPGGSESVWMFNGYFGERSKCLCAFTGRKLRQRGPRTGPTTLGLCVHNETVAAAATRLMGELDYRGIVDMGFRYDARDGQYKLLDVNPRLGSTFRLFVADNGIDVVRALHLDLTGREVPFSSTRQGRKWIEEPGDVTTVAQLAREGDIGLRAWGRSLSRIEEAAWWARDDPVPFFAMSARFGPYALRALRRLRSTPTEADHQPKRPGAVAAEGAR
jgi:D-aspartate ligase